jgi:hypothetical protein
VRGASNPIEAAQEQLRVKTDSSTGRQHYRNARQDLQNLVKKMEDVAPNYTNRRGNSILSAKRVFEYLNSHQLFEE